MPSMAFDGEIVFSRACGASSLSIFSLAKQDAIKTFTPPPPPPPPSNSRCIARGYTYLMLKNAELVVYCLNQNSQNLRINRI